MEQLIEKLLNMIDVGYFISIIILSYLLIKAAEFIFKNKVLPAWVKRGITFLTGIILFFVFREFDDTPLRVFFTSYLFAMFVYDTAIKVLLNKFHIEYKK